MSERRDYFRIQTEILVNHQAIAADDQKTAVERFRQGIPDRFTLSAHFMATSRQVEVLHKRIAAENPDVAHYLGALDHKLDILARLMLADEHAQRGANLVVADLSATGLAFAADDALDIDSFVQLRFVLLPQQMGIEAIGKIIRCDPLDDGQFRIALDFEHLREADREAIIEYSLERQAAALRNRQA